MATISSGSRFGLRIAAESTYATPPAGGVYQALEITGCDLQLKIEALQSAAIRADRQIAHFRHGMRSIEGSIDMELAVGGCDQLLEAALAGSWGTASAGVRKLIVGTAMQSFSLERAFTDASQYDLFNGCVVNTMDVSLQPSKIATVKFGLIGQDCQPMQTAAYSTTVDPYAGNEPLDAFSGALKVGGTAIAVVTGLDFKLANGRKGQGVVGSRHTPAIFEGKSDVTGSATVMFQDSSVYNRFVNETETAIDMTLTDVNGTDYQRHVLPRVKFSTGNFNIPAEGPVLVTMDFQALYDTVTGTNYFIERTNA